MKYYAHRNWNLFFIVNLFVKVNDPVPLSFHHRYSYNYYYLLLKSITLNKCLSLTYTVMIITHFKYHGLLSVRGNMLLSCRSVINPRGESLNK